LHVCECNKKFNTHSGLWKHKNKCEYEKIVDTIQNKDEDDVKILTNMVLEVVKQNNDLMIQNTETQKQNQELTNKLFEICKNGTNNTMINNN
jgi:DNA-binding FadR family transcriptional regulator